MPTFILVNGLLSSPLLSRLWHQNSALKPLVIKSFAHQHHWPISDIYCPDTHVCDAVTHPLISYVTRLVWMLNISGHIIASNKADSSLSPPFSPPLITPFQFPFPPSRSSHAPSICRRPLTSPSTPALRFHFPPPRLHFLSVLFTSFPFLMQIRGDTTCMNIDTHKNIHIHAGKWLKAEMYTVHELILGLNQHIDAAFLIEAMDCLKA